MFPVHTYSIVARDPESGELGVAVQSHYFSVGSVVTWAEAGVGAVATQSMAKIDYGPDALSLLRVGLGARQALASLLENDPERERRQVAVVDARGEVAAHTGAHCIDAAGHLVGEQFSVQANLMVDANVWPTMRDAYQAERGPFAERLVAALAAAQESGGDIRGQQSAALLVVAAERSEKPWQGRLLELRVEDHPRPVDELRRLLRVRRAYEAVAAAEALFLADDLDAGRAKLDEALALAPGNAELEFWPAVHLLAAGREEAATLLFRDVFGRAPVFADLLPRLVDAGLLPNDPAALERVARLRRCS